MRKMIQAAMLLMCTVLPTIVFAGVAVGDPQGQVTLVEFFDYQCPNCKQMAPIVDQLIQKNPNLKVVYNDFPFIDSTSTFAARAGLAAVVQNKYKDYHDAVMQASIPLTDDKVMNIAQKIGLNKNQLLNAMGSPAVTAQLKQELETAGAFNVQATPTFVIFATNGKAKPTLITGKTTYDKLQQAINQYAAAAPSQSSATK